jgi:hypothetical protein
MVRFTVEIDFNLRLKLDPTLQVGLFLESGDCHGRKLRRFSNYCSFTRSWVGIAGLGSNRGLYAPFFLTKQKRCESLTLTSVRLQMSIISLSTKLSFQILVKSWLGGLVATLFAPSASSRHCGFPLNTDTSLHCTISLAGSHRGRTVMFCSEYGRQILCNLSTHCFIRRLWIRSCW